MTADEAYSLVEMMKTYFDDHADIQDSDYGQSIPNREMRLADAAERVLTFLEKLP